MEIRFIAAPALKSTMDAIGVPVAEMDAVTHCPFQVGDVIAYPPPAHFAVRVTRRWFRPGNDSKPPRWYLDVEQSPHPLDGAPQSPPRG
jgi:hypothetical protein